MLNPFLPFSSEKLFRRLNLESVWKPQAVKAGYRIPEGNVLFVRLDPKKVMESFPLLAQ
jgi:methionyl-tRNA synthetase